LRRVSSRFCFIEGGYPQGDISKLVDAGFAKMGLKGDALVLTGASAALPHGTVKPQSLRDGDVILVDGGCKVEGYSSDVTRTGIYGKPPEKIQRTYEIVRKAQDAALDAARKGRFSGSVTTPLAVSSPLPATDRTTNSLLTAWATGLDSTSTIILIWCATAKPRSCPE
jgi:hypothetical protein